jgi:hypothetical protein
MLIYEILGFGGNKEVDECLKIVKDCEHVVARISNPSPKSLASRQTKITKITVFKAKEIEVMATSSEEKTTINGVGSNLVLQ